MNNQCLTCQNLNDCEYAKEMNNNKKCEFYSNYHSGCRSIFSWLFIMIITLLIIFLLA